jgi:peptide/nickel transport system ATP-binding protein
MRAPLLAIRDLEVAFAADEGRVRAVAGASLDVPRHRTVALVGESGSGKTVISQAVLGILPKNARIERGSIWFSDPRTDAPPVDLAAMPPGTPERRAIQGRRISIIFQEPMSSLSPLHTIGDQIGESLRVHEGASGEEARARTVEMLSRVGFRRPAEAVDRYPFELSGGLRQRAMIALALICGPALLIADEPTTALDVTVQAQILKLMKDLQAEMGMSILFITHDLGVVASMADEIVVLYRGRVVERGGCEELLRDPRHPYLQALLRAVPRLHTDRNERLQALREVRVDGDLALGGPRTDAGAADGAGDGRAPLLQVEGLRKTFLTRRAGLLGSEPTIITAVDDVSFEIRRGESFALVGESGSGKTTVSKMIMRGLTADTGRITFHGADGRPPVDVLALGEDELRGFRRHIQYIFQDPFGSLNPRMTVLDLVAEPLVIHGVGTEKERVERVKRLLQAVGLDVRHLRRYPHSFSGGQRQRIGIARALALEPELLICDEPVSALDVSVQAQILNLLKDLQARLGLTYLFIAHNLAVVRYIADRIAVMCAGRLVELAPTDALFAGPRHPYTQALLAAVPEPDPDRPLDLAARLAEGAMDPTAWPEPYTLRPGAGSGRLVDAGAGHYVRLGTEGGLP